jgi:hypothetical protein
LHVSYLKAIAGELTLTKHARIEFAHRQSAEATGEVTNALTHLLRARENALAAVETRVRIATLHPVVAAGYQFNFVVYV